MDLALKSTENSMYILNTFIYLLGQSLKGIQNSGVQAPLKIATESYFEEKCRYNSTAENQLKTAENHILKPFYYSTTMKKL